MGQEHKPCQIARISITGVFTYDNVQQALRFTLI
jgi:hypothetical protein